jgi:hypothetical protein
MKIELAKNTDDLTGLSFRNRGSDGLIVGKQTVVLQDPGKTQVN